MVERCERELRKIRDAVRGREDAYAHALSLVHDVHKSRARNLVRFVAFREHARGELHDQLQRLGLDPLADAEWDVLHRVDTVLHRLGEMSGSCSGDSAPEESAAEADGRELLRLRTEVLFGPARRDRDVRIMITLPAEAADEADIIRDLASGGADCFRINCARDDRETWKRLIQHARECDIAAGHPHIFLDLGGPKLRVSSCGEGKKSIVLEQGDTLHIKRHPHNPTLTTGEKSRQARREITVNYPSGLDGVMPGHHVWFDDGKIGGVVREMAADAICVEITCSRKGGRKLRMDRGMNLPDTGVRLPSLTEKDLDDLPFAARHADFLALSFIRTPSDVDEFRAALLNVSDVPPTMVIKIETREALSRLPDLMLAGMRSERVAMLLARGDLAVECGILEMPRIQKKVLRYCAAASLPLFWATGVLERASRLGEPTRAEMTDATAAARAQCVMLNKGSNSRDALRLLGELLLRCKEEE